MTDKKTYSITVTISTNSSAVMLRIQRWLAWMHFNTRWGHSATIGMDLDGDGNDKVTVEGLDDLSLLKDYVRHPDRKNIGGGREIEMMTSRM